MIGTRRASSALPSDFHASAHRLAIGCAGVHLLICLIIASFTGTWFVAFAVGVPAVAFPAFVALTYPESLLSRLAMAAGFMMLTALVIEQSGGDQEAHFSFFVMISVLLVYADRRPIWLAGGLIILHHLTFTLLQPSDLGFYVWNDSRGAFGHLAVHGLVVVCQTAALTYIAMMLRSRMGLEIENAALGQSLRDVSEAANKDMLTGLFNRRHLETMTDNLEPLVMSGQELVTLCVVDIDHFKTINDRFGHVAGDQVLKAVARSIGASIGETESAFRYGGEEFVCILRNCSLNRGKVVAETIRKAIAVSPVTVGGETISVTVSIGLSLWSEEKDFHLVFQQADHALYSAKSHGRNRVQIFTAADLRAVALAKA